ncbi:hypothetical protein GCM10025783_27100 [Amnibacterium soli]|uniref:PKD domain-containing protein n=1 Tax=Amnibacterium soli TaxID=1282736 RepID=A0ABP8ZC87_9MICO
MVRRIYLLTSAVLLLVLAGSVPLAAADSAACDFTRRLAGLCTSGSTDGTGVDVRGTTTRPGQDGSAGRGGSGAGSSGPARPLTDAELAALLDAVCFGDGACGVRESVALNPLIPAQPAAEPEEGDDAAPVVTIDDLARFLPATAALHAEPNGWAVVGVPANFWAEASPATVAGELLDRAAEVRFTPQAYRFDYGDGSSKTSATAGASWAALGQEELTGTPTSHVYWTRGDVQARVTVVYSAQYRVAGGRWIRVAGAVSGTAPPERVLVVVERTALTTPA